MLADFDQYSSAYKLRMESIKAYLVHKKVPKPMSKRVRKFCAHYFAQKGALRENMEMLPPRLHRELLLHEHR